MAWWGRAPVRDRGCRQRQPSLRNFGDSKLAEIRILYNLTRIGTPLLHFAEGRIGYREWARRNGRLGDIHRLDGRFDHDIDELMA